MNPQDVVQKYDLDLDSFFVKADQILDRYDQIDEVVSKLSKGDPFQKINESTRQNNQTLGQQVQIYQKVSAAAASYRKENENLRKIIAEIREEQKGFVSAAKYDEIAKKLETVQAKLATISAPLKEADSLWDKLKAKFANGLTAKITVPTPIIPPTPSNTPSSSNRGADGRFKSKGDSDSADDGKKPKGGIAGIDALVGNLLGIKDGEKISGVATKLLGLIGVTFGVTEALKLAVTESAKFGKSLSELSALTGVTGKDLDFLADAAVDLENKTGIAATDIVEGFKLVGGIKPELLENKEALAQVTDEVIALSQASGISLQDAATSAVGALNQFGEGADQAGRFVNVLAAGAKLGASEVNDTAEALKNSGTAIKAAGLSFEQGNAVLQSLAGVMIKGAEAGTGLRNVLLKLETDSDKNLRPSIVGLDKALENAAKKYNTTTELTKVFGVENIVAARRILDTRKEITQLTADLTGTNTAYEQQKTNLDNLSTDLSKAGTATVGFFRDLGQSQDGFIRRVVQGYTGLLQFVTSKTGVFKAFFSSLFDREDGGIGVAFEKAAAQGRANEQARAQGAKIAGIKTASIQSVADDTKALTDLYEKQGQTLPKAQRAAAEKVAAARDDEYKQAVADHQRLRKEFEKADANERVRLGKNEFEASRRRQLAARTAKATADANLARLKKASDEQAAALKTALGEGPTDEEKKSGKAREKATQDNYKLLLAAAEDYSKEYFKLEEEFGKDRLDNMKRDGEGYILEKARLDKKEIDAQRDHLEKLLQLAASNQTKINKATGQREIVANTSVRLPADMQAAFDERKRQVDLEADRQVRLRRIRADIEVLQLARQTNQTELELFDKHYEELLLAEEKGSEKYAELVRQRDNARLDYVKKGNQDELNEFDAKWAAILAAEEKNAKKYAAQVKKRDADRRDLVFDQIIRDSDRQQRLQSSSIALRKKGNDTTGTAFARQNEIDEIDSQILAAGQKAASLEAMGNPANLQAIKDLDVLIKTLKEKRKEISLLGPINRDIWDLLGVSKSFADETERQIFLTAVDMIGKAVQQATEEIVKASDARIQALDNEIQAKENQLKTEEERDRQGFANNKSKVQAEIDLLKKQKAEEQETRKKALIVQQSLDLASQVSSNAVTVANTITAVSEMFKQYGKIPVVGIFLALGAIATIAATIASVKAKAKAITQLREGGGVPRRWGLARGPRHEQGGIRGTGAFDDIEIEGGEFVNDRQSSERYNKTLNALNKDDAHAALQHLLSEGNIGLPALIAKQLIRADFGGVGNQRQDFSQLEKLVGEHGELLRMLVNNTKRGKETIPLGDGWVLERDGNRETKRKITTP